MRNMSFGRLGALVAGTAACMVALALPATALTLGISLGNGPLLHVADCRSVALARNVNYDMLFSSNTTGALPTKVSGVVDGSLNLCWDLNVRALSDVKVNAETAAAITSLINGLLQQSDASKICSSINLVLNAGVTGTVSASVKAHVSLNGAPPVDWAQDIAKDIAVSPNGENIVWKACVDTSGNVTAS